MDKKPLGVARVKSEKFKTLTHNPDKLYFITDTNQIYLGDELFSNNVPVNIEKVDDYLYNINYDLLDYEYAKNYFLKYKPDIMLGGCSSIRKDTLYGRNFDWKYNNQVEFVIKTSAYNNHHSVIGVASDIPQLTKEVVEQRRWDDVYNILPFVLADGINDAGLVCSINVVPLDKGKTTGTTPTVEKKDEICSLMVPRYILDHFSTVLEAIDYITKYVSIYVPSNLHDSNYETHFMLADKNNTYVIEFIDNRVIAIDISEYPYLTNFYIDDIVRNLDGSVYTPATQTKEDDAIITNGITEHGAGLERYNLINSEYTSINSIETMRILLDKLTYTNTYKRTTDPFWYTEFIYNDLQVNSPINDFTATVDYIIDRYENRTREDEIPTWQTTHSSIYDIEGKTLSIKVQEADIEYLYKFDTGIEPTKAEYLDIINAMVEAGFIDPIGTEDGNYFGSEDGSLLVY